MDIKEELDKRRDNPNNLKTYPLAKCRFCKTTEDIFICEQGHNKFFCKECLYDTEIREYGTYPKVHCSLPTCNFQPLSKGKAYMSIPMNND